MRPIFALTFLAVGAHLAHAQEQESKLLNRLLKPNTTLTNSAQSKEFTGGTEAATKKAAVAPFTFQERLRLRLFSGKRDFAAAAYPASTFRRAGATADFSSRSDYSRRVGSFDAPTAPLTQTNPDSTRTVSVSDFNQSRPFLDRGKSQKALSAHDTPMTIEQVRELLNRNK